MENKIIEEQKYQLIKSLSPKQKEYLEAVDWLYHGARGSGRTHLICTVAILNILNGGDPAIVIDHYQNIDPNRNYTKAVLHSIANKIGLRIKIREYDRYALYVTRDRTTLMYEEISEVFRNLENKKDD